jgi:hypothetical protein
MQVSASGASSLPLPGNGDAQWQLVLAAHRLRGVLSAVADGVLVVECNAYTADPIQISECRYIMLSQKSSEVAGISTTSSNIGKRSCCVVGVFAGVQVTAAPGSCLRPPPWWQSTRPGAGGSGRGREVGHQAAEVGAACSAGGPSEMLASPQLQLRQVRASSSAWPWWQDTRASGHRAPVPQAELNTVVWWILNMYLGHAAVGDAGLDVQEAWMSLSMFLRAQCGGGGYSASQPTFWLKICAWQQASGTQRRTDSVVACH